MIANTETTHRTQALAESTNDEINLVQHTLCFCHTAAALPKNTDGMRFIHQQTGTKALFEFYNFCQGRTVTQHAIHALDYNQAVAGAVLQSLESTFKALHIIVLKPVYVRIAHATAIIKTSVGIRIQQNYVPFAQ